MSRAAPAFKYNAIKTNRLVSQDSSIFTTNVECSSSGKAQHFRKLIFQESPSFILKGSAQPAFLR